MEIRHHQIDRIAMDLAGLRKPCSAKIEHFSQRGGDALHRKVVELGERTFDEPAVIDRAELVDEQVGIMSQQQQNEHGPGLASARLAGPASKGYSSS